MSATVLRLSEKRAERLLEKGLDCVSTGEIEKARALFKDSAENYPTADAYTYWAWMEHHVGNTLFAIRLCRRAIRLDPDFGNPYNDIGSYLISLGDLDGAIEWLERAIEAKRYEPRQYPHINLGRVYLAKGQPKLAVEQFRKALEYAPDDPEIVKAIENILTSIH